MWNMPAFPTPFIGREQEVTSLCAMLQQAEMRLLTLVGMGGIGKTRLSVEAATRLRAHFTDGICFVALAPISDPDLVVPTIANALRMRETPGRPLGEQVKAELGQKQLLLLLDNFEQVAQAASLIEELLLACSQLKVLITSRAVLHLQAEYLFAVPPLALPDLSHPPSYEALIHSPAVALFQQRARAVLPTFHLTPENVQTIVQICLRLEGLPLALELAAARIRLLPPQALLSRLASRLQVLTGGARTLPPRQHTLRKTLQWSYDLLTPEEQQLLRRLSIFVGGCYGAPGRLVHSGNGGPALVKAAYQSGTPAIGVGAGNAPVLVCADADLEEAASNIVSSKAFDNGMVCCSEHNLVVVQSRVEVFKQALERHGLPCSRKKKRLACSAWRSTRSRSG
jgi:hypothetical protein